MRVDEIASSHSVNEPTKYKSNYMKIISKPVKVNGFVDVIVKRNVCVPSMIYLMDRNEERSSPFITFITHTKKTVNKITNSLLRMNEPVRM